MRWWLAVVVVLLGGCNCNPPSTPDSGTPTPPPPEAVAWPEGARLEITETTATSASVQWPTALGAVTSYRLIWPDGTQDSTSTSYTFTALTAHKHLPVEVIALADDGTKTPPLRAEVAPATKLNAPDGDISTDFCGANAFLKQGVS
jgi:hypothetical protein